jgi:hypothetical protein
MCFYTAMNNASATHSPESADTRTAWDVVREHRAQSARARRSHNLQIKLLGLAIDQRESVRAWILEGTAGDRTGARRAALLKRISHAAQGATLLRLTTSYQRVIQMERVAWGLGPCELPPELDPAAQRQQSATQTAEQERESYFDGLRARVKQAMEREAAKQQQHAAHRPAQEQGRGPHAHHDEEQIRRDIQLQLQLHSRLPG